MKFSQTAAITVLGVAGTLSACGADGTPQGVSSEPMKSEQQRAHGAPEASISAQAHSSAVAMPSNKPVDSSADNLESFLPEGARILSSATGDLNGDGRMDAVIVVDPSRTGKEYAGEGPSRIVMLLIRDGTGVLHKAKESDTLVPCAMCGGMAGDPFELVQVKNGKLTVVVSGGSPSSRWNEVYEFDYKPQIQDWTVSSVDRGVSDKIEDRVKREVLTATDLGETRFKEFDRSSLPPSPTF